MEYNNKRNLYYFEGETMKELHDELDDWQNENQKRFLSLNIQRENSKYCCIALSNPTEVVILDGSTTGPNVAWVDNGKLLVSNAEQS